MDMVLYEIKYYYYIKEVKFMKLRANKCAV
jgi:hypothetical protein